MIDRGGGASDEIDPDPDQACCRLFKKPIRRRRRIALFSFLHRVLSLPNSSPCSLITLPLLTDKAVLRVIRRFANSPILEPVIIERAHPQSSTST